jgi:hypothetical protein
MRAALASLLVFLAACSPSDGADEIALVVQRVDHLVLAVADLDEGIAQIEAATGVRAQVGGSHPGHGTRNALLALGPRVYLEILGPDPAQANAPSPQSVGLSAARPSRLVAWAAGASDLEKLVADAGARGIAMSAPESGTRRRPDGKVLSWSNTALKDERVGDGLVPFFIDWGATEHPAVAAPKGVRLVGLRAQHPSPGSVQPTFDALGIPLEIATGSAPALIAILDTPRGRIELR